MKTRILRVVESLGVLATLGASLWLARRDPVLCLLLFVQMLPLALKRLNLSR